jgi:hypothetical protein
MDPIAYDAVVRPDRERGTGYIAVSTARHRGAVKITDWEWTGYGNTPEEAIADLERVLQDIHQEMCWPRRIVYELDP